MHAAVTARLAGFLGSKDENLESDVCLTYGLILDIGKIAIKVFHPEEMLAAVEFSVQEKTPLDVVLQQNLGFSHHEVAATLAKGWNYPDSMVSFLQSPEPYNTGDHSALGSVSLLAKKLASEWGYGDGLGVPFSLPKWELMEKGGVSKNDLTLWEPVMKKAAEQVAHTLRTQKLP